MFHFEGRPNPPQLPGECYGPRAALANGTAKTDHLRLPLPPERNPFCNGRSESVRVGRFEFEFGSDDGTRLNGLSGVG